MPSPSLDQLTYNEYKALRPTRLKIQIDHEGVHSDLALTAEVGHACLMVPVRHIDNEDLGQCVVNIFNALRGVPFPDLEGVELVGRNDDWQTCVTKACRAADVSVFAKG